jgi:hypothetical protein
MLFSVLGLWHFSYYPRDISLRSASPGYNLMFEKISGTNLFRHLTMLQDNYKWPFNFTNIAQACKQKNKSLNNRTRQGLQHWSFHARTQYGVCVPARWQNCLPTASDAQPTMRLYQRTSVYGANFPHHNSTIVARSILWAGEQFL